MWCKTLLLLSVLLSFTNAQVPAVSGDPIDDFQSSHAVHLKTSNGVKIKLLISLPPDLQPEADDNGGNSEQIPTNPLLPADPPAPIENNPIPELPVVPELPIQEELPSEHPQLIPNVPSVSTGGGPSSMIPIVFTTLTGVKVKLHVNIPPEFQHIIEAHESVTVPGSALPPNPVPLPIPQPILPKPEPVEDESQVPTLPKPEDSENQPEGPVVSNPELPEDESQGPIIPRPEQPILQPVVPENKPIGIKPVVLDAGNGIKLKLFIDIPPHLASLIDVNQSIQGPPSVSIPTGPGLPGIENPSAPGVEAPTHPELIVPGIPGLEVPGLPAIPSDPQQPDNSVPSVPQTPETGGVVRVPDPSKLNPMDQLMRFSTESGIKLHVKVNTPTGVSNLIQQQSEVVYVKN